jgi:rare lipoprotein A
MREPAWIWNHRLLRRRLSPKTPALFVVGLLVIQGCSSISSKVTSLPTPETSPPPKGRPVYIGNASWYGPGFNGKITASGSAFDETKFTAAHRTLPLGSKAKVTNLSNGKSVEVEINDRGPFARNRIIDLSQAAAKALGIIDHGVARVSVEALGTSVSADNANK